MRITIRAIAATAVAAILVLGLLPSSAGAQNPPQVPSPGSYVPLVSDFNRDGRDDILFYGTSPSVREILWFGQASGTFVAGNAPQAGRTDLKAATGDFDGDGFGEIMWYAPGHSWFWEGTANGGFTTAVGPPVRLAGLIPIGSNSDFDGNGSDDIVWYGQRSADYTWYGTTRGFAKVSGPNIAAAGLTPILGDFDGDGRDDITWYVRNSRSARWWGRSGGFDTGYGPVVRSGFIPYSGDPIAFGADSIVWWCPGTCQDYTWIPEIGNRSAINGPSVSITATRALVAVGNFDGDTTNGVGSTDLFFQEY